MAIQRTIPLVICGDSMAKLFVIMPFATEFEDRFATIKAVAEKEGWECERGDTPAEPGAIAHQVMELIAASKCCVADVTGNNPNVFLELGYAYHCRKPVILISRDPPDKAPFDIRHMRIIQYSTEKHDAFTRQLEAALNAVQKPVDLLRQLLVPKSLYSHDIPFVIASNPLPPRPSASRDEYQGTSSDNVGVLRLIQSFGLIYGNNRIPDLVHPADYSEDVCLNAQMHIYCIASPKPNRWTGALMRNLNKKFSPAYEFRPDPGSDDFNDVRVQLHKNDKLIDLRTFQESVEGGPQASDFGLILRAPHPIDSGRMVLILAGRSSLGTQAACLAATDPDQLQEMKRLEPKLDLDNHRQPFVAFFSMQSFRSGPRRYDPETLKLCDVLSLEPRSHRS
jgi:hypothetical protein